MFQITRKDNGQTRIIDADCFMAACAALSQDGTFPLDVVALQDDAAPVTGDEPTATGMPEVEAAR